MERNTILFVVTFGAGLGHLARTLSIASRIRKYDDHINIVFFTTSPVTTYLYEAGFYYYYIPDRLSAAKKMKGYQWEAMFYHHLSEIIKIHQPDEIVYDGGYPPNGFIRCHSENKKPNYIWIKREGDRKLIRSASSYEQYFDYLIIPGEQGMNNRENTGKCKVVNPIIYDPEEKQSEMKFLFPNYDVTKFQIWYIQLGAGLINDFEEDKQRITTHLLKSKNALLILADSPVSKKASDYCDSRIAILHTFPNSIYFPYIDYAVSAAGYNSFYELLYYGVPTLYLPNRYTSKDDQVARARRASEMGTGRCLESIDDIEQEIIYLQENKEQIKRQCDLFSFENGAKEAAKFLLDFL